MARMESSSCVSGIWTDMRARRSGRLWWNLQADRVDLVLSYQRRAFSNEFRNHHLRDVPCVIELPARDPLARRESVSTEDLQEMPCILVARKGQREIERSFYHDVLGIGREYYFVENMDDARLSVLGGQGFLPLPELTPHTEGNGEICRLLVFRPDGTPIRFNFCAFWKRARSSATMEEFVTLLTQRV